MMPQMAVITISTFRNSPGMRMGSGMARLAPLTAHSVVDDIEVDSFGDILAGTHVVVVPMQTAQGLKWVVISADVPGTND